MTPPGRGCTRVAGGCPRVRHGPEVHINVGEDRRGPFRAPVEPYFRGVPDSQRQDLPVEVPADAGLLAAFVWYFEASWEAGESCRRGVQY